MSDQDLKRIADERRPVRWILVDVHGPEVTAWHLVDANDAAVCGHRAASYHIQQSWTPTSGRQRPEDDHLVCSLCKKVARAWDANGSFALRIGRAAYPGAVFRDRGTGEEWAIVSIVQRLDMTTIALCVPSRDCRVSLAQQGQLRLVAFTFDLCDRLGNVMFTA